MEADIIITITTTAAGGKTTLSEAIGDTLRRAGLTVVETDDDRARGFPTALRSEERLRSLAERGRKVRIDTVQVPRAGTVTGRLSSREPNTANAPSPLFSAGRQYVNRHTGRLYLACDCGWSRTDPDERRSPNGYVVLFEVGTGLRYNPDNIDPADWYRVER
jgi:hypothetical protein